MRFFLFFFLTLNYLSLVSKSSTQFINDNLPRSKPNKKGGVLIKVAYPNLPDFEEFISIYPIPNSNLMALVLRNGKIYTFEDDPEVSKANLILDISDRIFRPGLAEFAAYNVCALYSIAFHPDFNKQDSPNKNFCYVFYTHNIKNRVFYQLSRFTLNRDLGVIDKDSELILIRHLNSGDNAHVGNELFFDKDGFLYISVGDLIEAGKLPKKIKTELYDDTQRIDRIFNSCVLRIDIDKDEEKSHPIRKHLQKTDNQKEPSMGKNHPLYAEENFSGNYYIPNDNPFVDQDNVLGEYFSLGSRNPYKMSYDKHSNKIFIGDVGSNMKNPLEEIYILEKGSNHGWSIMEGTSSTEVNEIYNIKKTINGDLISPDFYYDHSIGSSVTGGFVYRGKDIKSLYGKYIFGDFISRAIWSYDFAKKSSIHKNGDHIEKIATFSGNQLRSFGVNHKKEMLILGFGGKIHKLIPSKVTQDAPKSLKDIKISNSSNLYKALEKLKLPDSFIPYEINSEFWLGGVNSRRWVFLPKNSKNKFVKIENQVKGSWQLPIGSAVIKHIYVNNKDSKNVPIETQILVYGEDNIYYALVYRWENDDAVLIEKSTPDKNFSFFSSRFMSMKDIKWKYGNPKNCFDCHKSTSGSVLGLKTFQLNKEINGNNQLTYFESLGILKNKVNLATALKGKNILHSDVGNLEIGVKSWLDVNCAFCHSGNKGSAGRALFDLQFSTAINDSGLFTDPVIIPFKGKKSKLLRSGDTINSLLYFRASSNIPGISMPPLQSFEPDKEAMLKIHKWISEMKDNISLKIRFKKVNKKSVTSFNVDDLCNIRGELDRASFKLIKKPKFGDIKYDSETGILTYSHKSFHREYDKITFSVKTLNGVKSGELEFLIGIWGRNKSRAIIGLITFSIILFFSLIFWYKKRK